MSDEELKAELERLRKDETLKGSIFRYPHEGERKGSSLDLRNGALSCDPV